ncbi:MAG: hypothetical protein ACYDC1_21790 [Limisphaerales bacterium]
MNDRDPTSDSKLHQPAGTAGDMPAARPSWLDQGSALTLLGVDYRRFRTPEGGDLFLTHFGEALAEHLQAVNWFESEWFSQHRQRLAGTSTIYRVASRPVEGRALDLVVRYCRVGEELPVDTLTLNRYLHAEFNSPFEEFAALMELRAGRHGPGEIRIRAQKPLAIYCPPDRLERWQTGRIEDKLVAKLARNPEVPLDIQRQYLVVFGWIKGLDAVQMAQALGLEGTARLDFLARVTDEMIHDLAQKGFRVLDMKAQHVILRRRRDGSLLRDRDGQLACALVDYELLERTPEHEEEIRVRNLATFPLKCATEESVPVPPEPLPRYLAPVTIQGSGFLYGRAESTQGRLWVTGGEARRFNYFLPERWRRTPARPLIEGREVFLTRSKDHLPLIWRVSGVGTRVVAGGAGTALSARMSCNTPFDELSIARELAAAGIPVLQPEAVYATARGADGVPVHDYRRFQRYLDLRTPDGVPLLSPDQVYLTLWQAWGPDAGGEPPALESFLTGREAAAARALAKAELDAVMIHFREELARAGFEDLEWGPDKLLLVRGPNRRFRRNPAGRLWVALWNFEFVRRRASVAD